MEKQTAVEFLIKFCLNDLPIEQWNKYNGLFEQAKEMEQGKICLAFLEGQHHNDKLPSQYYIETYGSKESDEIQKESLDFLTSQAQEMGLYNTPKEIKKDSFGKIRFTEEEWAELNNASKGSDGHELDDDIPPTSQYFPTYSQTEISDEEIEKFADEELGTIRTDFDFGVIQGMKWYREQLKKL